MFLYIQTALLKLAYYWDLENWEKWSRFDRKAVAPYRGLFRTIFWMAIFAVKCSEKAKNAGFLFMFIKCFNTVLYCNKNWYSEVSKHAECKYRSRMVNCFLCAPYWTFILLDWSHLTKRERYQQFLISN